MASRHLAWAPGPMQQRIGSEQAGDADEQLLGLWDHMWFGLGSSSSPGCSSRRKSAAAFPADPLDNVVPVVGFAAMLPELMQPDGMVLPLSTNTLQQQAALNGQQQQQQQSAGQPQAAAALVAPSQPRPMWVPSAGGVAASRAAAVAAAAAAGSSPDRLIAQQQQQPQQQQSRELHQQQQQQDQEHTTPAPFVLGTWAQRQYIMPVQRPGQTAQSNEASPALPGPAGQHQQQHEARQGGSSSPARPIPRGKFPSSNGSSNSSGSTRGKAAQRAAAMQHSSSGGSSEPPPAAGTQQAADDAAAAAADAAEAAADGGLGAAANGDDAAAAALWQAAADAGRAARRSLGTDEEEEAVQQIAWRWRFARRWQAEQARGPLDPAATASVGDGGMEEALQYLAACGENWQHLSRESSRLGTVESRLLGTLGSLGGLGSELLADESFSAVGSGYGMQATLLQDTADSGGPLAASCAADSREVSLAGDGSCDGAQQRPLLQQPRAQEQAGQQGQQGQAQPRRQRGAVQPRGEATVQVTGITKRAQELLVAQEDINRQAHARWQQVSSKQGSSMWVGALLEGVCVDPWGKFKFMLLRVKDRNGRQVLLVRGANNASESKIVEELRKEMLAACNANDLPAEAIDILGGGVMEWTQHRDRHLHISCGYVARAGSGSGGPTTAGEVMRLAAVLTQQALPMHYKVTSDGDKQKL